MKTSSPNCRLALKLSGIAFTLMVMILISIRHLELYKCQSNKQANEVLSHRFDIEREHLLNENSVKRSLIHRLKAGEITLREAAEMYLAIDSGRPILLAYLRANYHGANDLEREAHFIVFLTGLQFGDWTENAPQFQSQSLSTVANIAAR